jgi:hypothetical protein
MTTQSTGTGDAIFHRAEQLTLDATEEPFLIPEYKTAMTKAKALEGAPGWKGKTKMTQVEKILNHIRKNGSITQREAYLDYGIQSFHRRLSDIREMGITLLPVQKTHPTTGQGYTRYYIAGDKKNQKVA